MILEIKITQTKIKDLGVVVEATEVDEDVVEAEDLEEMIEAIIEEGKEEDLEVDLEAILVEVDTTQILKNKKHKIHIKNSISNLQINYKKIHSNGSQKYTQDKNILLLKKIQEEEAEETKRKLMTMIINNIRLKNQNLKIKIQISHHLMTSDVYIFM